MFQSDFNAQGMSPEALQAWAAFERATGQGFGINSAFRDPAHNERVGGARNSQHTHGNAFDVDVSHLSHDARSELIEKARMAGFGGVGVYSNSLHFDVGPTRHWGPDYHAGSLPGWAADAVGAQRQPQPVQGPAGGPVPQEPAAGKIPDGLFARLVAENPETGQSPASTLADTLANGDAFKAPDVRLPARKPVRIAASKRDTVSPLLKFIQQMKQ